jgi:hypothetical protein
MYLQQDSMRIAAASILMGTMAEVAIRCICMGHQSGMLRQQPAMPKPTRSALRPGFDLRHPMSVTDRVV